MTDQIREQVSALLDGELPQDEIGLLVRRMERDPELRRAFGSYSLIGEILRAPGGRTRARRSRARVSAAIDCAGASGPRPRRRGAERVLEAPGIRHRTRRERGARRHRLVRPSPASTAIVASRTAAEAWARCRSPAAEPDAGAEPAPRELSGRAQPVLDADRAAQCLVGPARGRSGPDPRLLRNYPTPLNAAAP